jgi:hypothetical protein
MKADGHTAKIAHLRDVLGDQTYESLAREGETMSREPWSLSCR